MASPQGHTDHAMRPSWRSTGSEESLLEEQLNATEVEQRKCRSLPFTVLLWSVFFATQIGHRQIQPQNAMQRALTGVLSNSVSLTVPRSSSEAEPDATPAEATPGAASAGNPLPAASNATRRRLLGNAGSTVTGATIVTSKSLAGVSKKEDILDWLSGSLVTQLWAEGPQGRGVLNEFNRAVGGLRVRSTRLGSGTCPGSAGLLEVYNVSCYSDVVEGSEDSGWLPSVKSVKVPGMTTDSAGIETLWLDLAQDEATVQAQIQQLSDSAWLTPGMQSVTVQSVVLNAQISLVALAEARFQLDRAGRLITFAAFVNTLPTEVYGGKRLVLFGDIFLVVLLAGLGLFEAWHLCKACCRRCPRTFWEPIRALNWIVVGYGLGFSAFFGYLSFTLEYLADSLGGIPNPPDEAMLLDSGDSAWEERHGALDGVFSEVGRLSELLRWAETSAFWYSLFLMLKFFEAFGGSPRLAVITATLQRCFSDMVHFMVIFAIVFANFALGAYFLFGHQLQEWSNWGRSLNTAFRTMMGDFDFQEMWRIAPLSAITWFWLFMILVVLVMLSMLLAIVMDAYCEVKEKTQDQSTLWEQCATALREAWSYWTHRRNADANNQIEGFSEDGADIEEAERGDAGAPKLRGVAFSEPEPASPPALEDDEPPRPLVPISPSRRDSATTTASRRRGSIDERELLRQTEGLSEEISELRRLPVLFKQLEDACRRYFWLTSSSRAQAKDNLAKILIEPMPVPNTNVVSLS